VQVGSDHWHGGACAAYADSGLKSTLCLAGQTGVDCVGLVGAIPVKCSPAMLAEVAATPSWAIQAPPVPRLETGRSGLKTEARAALAAERHTIVCVGRVLVRREAGQLKEWSSVN
jgi:hypothetical protein